LLEHMAEGQWPGLIDVDLPAEHPDGAGPRHHQAWPRRWAGEPCGTRAAEHDPEVLATLDGRLVWYGLRGRPDGCRSGDDPRSVGRKLNNRPESSIGSGPVEANPQPAATGGA